MGLVIEAVFDAVKGPGWGAETPVAKSKSTFLSCGPHEMAEGGVIAKMCTFSSLLFIHFNRNCSNLRSETSLWTENPSQVSIHTLDLCLLFQDIDKFGNEITQLARPLPVEYLIIDVSVCHLPAEVRTAGGGLERAPLEHLPLCLRRIVTFESLSSWHP